MVYSTEPSLKNQRVGKDSIILTNPPRQKEREQSEGEDPLTEIKSSFRRWGERKGRDYLSSKKNFDIRRAARMLVDKLDEEIERGHDLVPFIIMLTFALAKDSMDAVGDSVITTIVSIPIFGQMIGTVITPVKFLGGLFLTTVLFLFKRHKGYFLKHKIKFWYWILTFFVDNLPAFGLLPIQTLMVLWAWKNVKKRARKAEAKLKKVERMNQKEIEELNEDITGLDKEE